MYNIIYIYIERERYVSVCKVTVLNHPGWILPTLQTTRSAGESAYQIDR